MSEIRLHNLDGQAIGSVPTPKGWEEPPKGALLWAAVRRHLANQRQGTADTKTRGEVRGGGKKPWAQKHTGRARAGSIRSPIWRKGGIVFGSHPRDYRYAFPKRLRRLALLSSLRAKVADQSVVAVDSLEGLEPKTKSMGRLLGRLDVQKGALLVVDQASPVLNRICRNLPKVSVKRADDLNSYDVLSHSKLVLTAASLKRLEALVGPVVSGVEP